MFCECCVFFAMFDVFVAVVLRFFSVLSVIVGAFFVFFLFFDRFCECVVLLFAMFDVVVAAFFAFLLIQFLVFMY